MFNDNYIKLMKQMAYRSPKSNVKRTVWSKTDGRCWYCGKQTHPFGKDNDAFCVDHFHPRNKQENNEINNLVPACSYCNIIKKDMDIDSFRDIFFSHHATDRRFYF